VLDVPLATLQVILEMSHSRQLITPVLITKLTITKTKYTKTQKTNLNGNKLALVKKQEFIRK